ncbi:uncharacterized protein EV420DRAFT_1634697 [Desarmillaria tabescens]|uniref:Uncharacterized protein n=1 Tax=Armillaria tabescens TaxID=1929756 RepID=A0AA39T7R0_ARMTA|nr:uncharacterized protein EV420DRAFT_1634697 [Desarmillaria tabescens]KAK0470261.1 hypothetical protein EV420DRAFT_1634697 [Desarmillaria tabescens]
MKRRDRSSSRLRKLEKDGVSDEGLGGGESGGQIEDMVLFCLTIFAAFIPRRVLVDLRTHVHACQSHVFSIQARTYFDALPLRTRQIIHGGSVSWWSLPPVRYVLPGRAVTVLGLGWRVEQAVRRLDKCPATLEMRWNV